MEALVVHPESADQLKTVKAVLKALNVRFEQKKELPAHITSSIKKGVMQYEKGNLIELEAFKQKHFLEK